LRRGKMSGALDGIRVIDFGQYLAGPLAALLLADQGAEVIRVDPPGGPRWRHPANAVLQRGKYLSADPFHGRLRPGGAGTNRAGSPRPDGGRSIASTRVATAGSSWRHSSWASWRVWRRSKACTVSTRRRPASFPLCWRSVLRRRRRVPGSHA
jgi:hypothetical protein